MRRRKRQRTASDRQAGFTLLELVIVFTILAIAATVALPLANRSRSGLALRSTVLEIGAQLRATRTAAIKSNSERTFNIDLLARSFWADGVVAPRPITGQAALDVVVPSSEQTSATSARVRFFPDGSSSGGQILLKGPGRTAVVSVDWVTGNPRIEWSN